MCLCIYILYISLYLVCLICRWRKGRSFKFIVATLSFNYIHFSERERRNFSYITICACIVDKTLGMVDSNLSEICSK